MEEEVKRFSKSLGSFCSHLQSSTDALNLSLLRRPIPLDSASTTFTRSLNQRISSFTTDLNLLETMSFGTVSFEELLGHCSEIYKKNQEDLLRLQDRLVSFGYVPELEIDKNEDEETDLRAPPSSDSMHSDEQLSSSPYPYSIMKSLEEDSLLDESLNLKNLGFSDACLATLASGAKGNESDMFSPESAKGILLDTKAPVHLALKTSELSDEEVQTQLEMDKTPGNMITVSKEEYKGLPSYMKSLASWEDLLGAVEKINSILNTKQKRKGCYYFSQDEIQTVGLGNKEKIYMLLLMRLNRFVVETTEGVVSYRVA